MTFKQNNRDDFTKGYLTEGLDNCLRPLIFGSLLRLFSH